MKLPSILFILKLYARVNIFKYEFLMFFIYLFIYLFFSEFWSISNSVPLLAHF